MIDFTKFHALPPRREYVVTLWLHRHDQGATRIEQPVMARLPDYAAALAGVMWHQLYVGVAITVEIERVELAAVAAMRRGKKTGILAAIRRRLAAIINPD